MCSNAQKSGINNRTITTLYPGGLGAATFIAYAKGTYGVRGLTEARAKELKSIWMKAYPEMQAFLQAREDKKFSTPENTYYIGETFTGRIRVRADFCSALNVRRWRTLNRVNSKKTSTALTKLKFVLV